MANACPFTFISLGTGQVGMEKRWLTCWTPKEEFTI